MAGVGAASWTGYYAYARANAHTEAVIGRTIGALPLDVTACSLLVTPPLVVRETYFLVWPRRVVDFKPDSPDSELGNCTGSRLVWVISPELIERLPAIRSRWPDGIAIETKVRQTYPLTFYLVGVPPPPPLAGNSPWPPYSEVLAAPAKPS